MRNFLALTLLALSPGAIAVAHADPLGYANPGHPAPPSFFTAATTGLIDGYFVSSDAGGEDSVRMIDVSSGTVSAWGLDNKTSVAGDSIAFGPVTAGDVLVFELKNEDLFNPDSYYVKYGGVPLGAILASDPAYSEDGIGHSYTEAYGGGTIGGVAFPAGTFVGMEDLPESVSDLDYNDINFVFTNVAAVTPAAVPEPSTLALLGTGVLGAAGALRRRWSR